MKRDSKFVLLLLPLLLCAGQSAFAQGADATRLFCGECRNPNVHPSDFGNHAFNIARAPNTGLDFSDISRMVVYNSAGEWAWVDLGFQMLNLDLAGFEIPTFVIPTGNIVITIQDSNGNLTQYVIDSNTPNELTVGSGVGPGYNSDADNSGSSSGSGSGGGIPPGTGGGTGSIWGGSNVPGATGNSGLWFDCRGDYSRPSGSGVICSY